MFRGRKLSDYSFPAALDAPPDRNPRRIVNGKDGSDAEVARFHRQFAQALEKAGWSPIANAKTMPKLNGDKVAPKTADPIPALVVAVVAAIVAWMMGAKDFIATTFGG